MKPDEFKNKMENLKTPAAENIKPPAEIKLAIMNARRSAGIGFWFVVVPYLFFILMLLKYELNINLGVLDAFGRLVGRIDGDPFLWWIQPVVLIVLPATGIVLNVLSITHFSWDTEKSSIVLTVKLRWVNILVLLFSVFIIGLLLLYLIVENFHASGL
jgi:lantibiotic transport system permease protein